LCYERTFGRVVVMTGVADLMAELSALTPAEQLDRLRTVEGELRRLEAELAVVVAVLDRGRVHRADGHASLRGLLRAELRWSDTDVTHRLRTARLVEDLPTTIDAVAAGTIGVGQVRVLARGRANPRCGDQLVDHETVLLALAGTLSFEEFTLCVRRWEQLADTDGAHRDADASHHRRHVSFVEHDGVGYLHGQGGAVDTAEMIDIWRRYRDTEFHADWDLIRHHHGDDASAALLPRTDAQRRWDALVRIFRDAAATPVEAQTPEATLNVVMDAVTFETTLARMRLIPHHHTPIPTLDDLPVDQWRCETTTGTLIDPCAAVAAVVIHGHVRRVVFDTAGQVIDLGRRRRLFTGAARTAVQLQATHCRWPGCSVPTTRCQIDHSIDWQHAGTTSPDNGALLCARHNRHKNHGYHTWRDPTGTWHTYRPDGTEIAPALPIPDG
jgi:Domain of unknown function (DUF222)